MTALTFDTAGSRFFETGIDRVVLYVPNGSLYTVVPWNGVSAITENVNGGEQNSVWLDSQKYMDYIENEDFQATLEAFGSPSEFAPCDGRSTLAPGLFATQQPRKLFNLSYRTLIGNDVLGTGYGYHIHLVYNCTASPSEKAHNTIGASTTPQSLSWQIDAVPVNAANYKPTAHLQINSKLITSTKLTYIENMIYGTSGVAPTFPVLADLITYMNS